MDGVWLYALRYVGFIGHTSYPKFIHCLRVRVHAWYAHSYSTVCPCQKANINTHKEPVDIDESLGHACYNLHNGYVRIALTGLTWVSPQCPACGVGHLGVTRGACRHHERVSVIVGLALVRGSPV